jgi:Pentapeptide repeats (8 copies)
MANDEHVALLKKGVDAWNTWRNENPNIVPDLQREHFSRMNLTEANLIEANLSGAYLHGALLFRANLSGANLCGTQLIEAHLRGASLNGANLSGAELSEAELSRVNLSGANLSRAILFKAYLGGANLHEANLSEASLNAAILTGADLRKANLSGADLTIAHLIETDFSGADLTGCRIYGVSAWRLKLEGAKQQNLVITRTDEPAITVDNIEVAQFIYLMLNNEKVRDVIDTITSKVVLILGRFTQERKPVLEALREELRQRKYLPILFDFEKPRSRNTDETITLLARMARFVVADISDAKSVLQELRAIVPDLPSVPVQPIILAMQEEPGMFDFYRNFRSFLNVHRYASQEQLIADLGEKVIRPAELKVLDLQGST